MKKKIVVLVVLMICGTCYASSRDRYSPTVTKSKGTATFVVAASDAHASVRIVADYRCDGTDDQSEINAAIAALPEQGGIISLSEGRFYINDTITIDKSVLLCGSGPGWSGFSTFNGTILCPTASMDDVIIDVNGGFYFGGMYELGVDGYLQAQDQTISGTGINIAHSGDFVIFHCIFAYLTYQFPVVLNCHAGWVFASDFELNPKASGALRLMNYNNWIYGCQFYSNWRALQVIADNQHITNCIFWASQENHITLSGNDVIISDCFFETWNVLGSTHSAIEFQDSSKKVTTISDCIFDGTNCDTPGIWDNDKTTNYINIHDNTFYDMGTARAIDMDTAIDCSVYNNKSDVHIYEQKVQTYQNTSGGSLAVGDVVIADATGVAYDGSQCTTTTAQGNDKVLGMVLETIADDAHGQILTIGKTTVLRVDGTANIAVGDIIGTFTTAKIGMKATSGDMGFAIALEVYEVNDPNGVIDAILINPRKL